MKNLNGRGTTPCENTKLVITRQLIYHHVPFDKSPLKSNLRRVLPKSLMYSLI